MLFSKISERHQVKPNLIELLPNVTSSITNKVLLLEVYFLLRSHQSPIYFSLTDFVENYSIELLYISVTLSLLTGWIFPLALAIYAILVGGFTWFGRKFLGLIRFQGIPIFEALNQRDREDSVSLSVAKDYAKSKADEGLQRRIDEYAKTSLKQLENEVHAATNFALVLLIAWISYSTGAPNFLMKVSQFADPITLGNAYQICLFLLLSQGLLGRMSGFHLLRASGNLTPQFFKSEEERKKVASWVSEMVDRNKSLAERWLNKQ